MSSDDRNILIGLAVVAVLFIGIWLGRGAAESDARATAANCNEEAGYVWSDDDGRCVPWVDPY